MPKTFAHIISTAFVPLASTTLLLTGCADYDEQLQEMMCQDSEGTIELRLNIGDESRLLSRAPQGGEHGDGREDGQPHENAVNNILVFYYNAGSGINANNGTTLVTKLAYVEDVPAPVHKTDANADPTCDPSYTYQSYYQTSVKLSPTQTNYYKYKTDDHYIVITNAGNFDAITLDDVRNKVIGNTWNGTGTDFTAYKDFVMSNEHESHYDSGNGTKDNPNQIIVTIERMAARIDFAFVADNDKVTKQTSINISGVDIPVLQYPANDTPKGGDKTKYGEVNLTHVRPFNVKQAGQGSYLIKRSAKPDKSGLKFLAPETAYAGGAVADFPLVIEPTTWTKGSVDPAPTPDTWYGGTYSTNVDAAYAADAKYAVHHATANDGFGDGLSTDASVSPAVNYYVLDYANENTMRVNESLKEYATGYILRAVYKPETVYKSTQADGSLLAADKSTTYTAGTTFSRYRPLVTEFDESQAVYFCNSVNPANTAATEALAKKYGDHILATTGVPYVIETFVNGVCYYPAYIRHDNAGGAVGVTPMEFGVVRNNIYRLKVTFSGPGYTTPEIQSTEPLGIKPYIYTRSWYKVEHEEITI